eukprot:TRINITY_DN9407_c0_g1_i1.p1 TRINITY_DN9407_c0_g1~~TRINITY_DN9407_c0_g1_i1.p1  ORF type:complete len:165 (-),score=54.98 TRINITY_DN9407_c0_g1_i1:48-542(-)
MMREYDCDSDVCLETGTFAMIGNDAIADGVQLDGFRIENSKLFGFSDSVIDIWASQLYIIDTVIQSASKVFFLPDLQTLYIENVEIMDINSDYNGTVPNRTEALIPFKGGSLYIADSRFELGSGMQFISHASNTGESTLYNNTFTRSDDELSQQSIDGWISCSN